MSRDNETAVTVITQGFSQRLQEAAGGTPCLVVFYGKEIGQRHFLDKSEQVLGRSDSANIQVDQESVSRQHCKVVTTDGRSMLYDLGSTNGTFVNDRRVDEAELRDGDMLRVGQTIFKYLSGSNIENKYHEEIYRLTTIDGLTQAYNKRYLLETLGRELNRADRYDRILSLAMFDIDHFKAINDTHGHLAGDHVLRELAALVTQHLRREDVFARYGGEEFAVVLPEVDSQGAYVACDKLRRLVEAHEFQFGGVRIPVTISVGIKTYEVGARGEVIADTNSLIAAADEKLYQAKGEGRNRVCT